MSIQGPPAALVRPGDGDAIILGPTAIIMTTGLRTRMGLRAGTWKRAAARTGGGGFEGRGAEAAGSRCVPLAGGDARRWQALFSSGEAEAGLSSGPASSARFDEAVAPPSPAAPLFVPRGGRASVG